MSTQTEEPLERMSEAGDIHDAFCFACGSNRVEVRRGLADYHTQLERRYGLVVCADCGSGRLADKLTAEEKVVVYPPTFYSYVVSARRNPVMRVLDKLRYDRHRFKPAFHDLLEIGSGCGEFLVTLKNRGNVVGLERSADARQAARELGVDVRVGNVNDTGLFDESSFDFIYLSHAFEHLDEPAAALRSMRRWLGSDGKVFISVPNFGGLLPRLFPKSWYNLALPLHVSQFTPAGITALLERNGFIVDEIRYNSDPFSIPMSMFFAASGKVASLKGFRKVAVFASTFALIPLSRLIDAMRRGDCMEVYAHKA